ncbi:MAG: FmdE family protein [Syntrophorhabdaceae bacterium]|nr:FmdE family protein [Syntrophorhabdaceae bacterium]MDD4195998.1 FmdE family protein [Syntrophorhabdaceae bacterium]HOC44998.1 FmdE family protein [Syntrophorhabdaceae bacterium]
MSADNLDFGKCLEDAKNFHGDLCAGITLGTRMSILGLKTIGINDPKGADRKNIIVFAETDRCVTDALLSITGCHPGKRTMKIFDYGKMAATFVNLKTGKAVRVVVKNKRDNQLKQEEGEDRSRMDAYMSIPAEDLFTIEPVRVDLKPEDMPGKPLHVTVCSACGERVMDKREVCENGVVLCKPCSKGERYYTSIHKDQ